MYIHIYIHITVLNHCVILECEIDLHTCNDFQLQTKRQPRFQWENIPSPKIIHIHILFCYFPSTQQIHSCIKHHTISLMHLIIKFRNCNYSPAQKLWEYRMSILWSKPTITPHSIEYKNLAKLANIHPQHLTTISIKYHNFWKGLTE